MPFTIRESISFVLVWAEATRLLAAIGAPSQRKRHCGRCRGCFGTGIQLPLVRVASLFGFQAAPECGCPVLRSGQKTSAAKDDGVRGCSQVQASHIRQKEATAGRLADILLRKDRPDLYLIYLFSHLKT